MLNCLHRSVETGWVKKVGKGVQGKSMAGSNRHVAEMKTCFLLRNRGAWNVLHGHRGF